ncbi:hypothetical protein [Priestia megaterium]|uniref:hypothetical protein n=1 Tax=Priestia megaterium TaxID=1404 RepID=UPI0030097E94
MLNHMMKDKVSLKRKNGQVYTDIRAGLQKGKILIEDISIIIEEGDTLSRILPSGTSEEYIVLTIHQYNKRFSIPAYYELEVRKRTSLSDYGEGTTFIDQSVNHFNGNNNRVNKHSTDNSSNQIYEKTEISVFNQLREKLAKSDIPETKKNEIINRVEELEKAIGTSNALSKYQNLISSAADHMTVLTPFIAPLTILLSNLPG